MTPTDLSGKAALVTGSSTGIGAAVAAAYGRAGMNVAVHYNRSREAAEKVAENVRAGGGKAVVLGGDARDPERVHGLVRETVDAFGRLDVLVNNAGSVIGRFKIEDSSDAFLTDMLDTNVRHVVAACRAAIPIMRKQGGGRIINTSSIAARGGGGGGSILYAACKGFVSTFTRGLAKEVARDGIRVNAVAPGVIMTALQDKFTPPEQIAAAIAQTPMGRTGSAEECVGAYLYLASEAMSGFVTGQILEVNGGMLIA
ncbi:MAG: SDR family oxidoreductase [Alphaproteobacteria bacterium]|nr:SDR family oxidoreductase [Alphaproteobacteria bacterium]